MAVRAILVEHAHDVWGDAWDVREERATAHGFAVALGWPHGVRRGAGGAGGPRVVVTPALAAYFEGDRAAPSLLALPIGGTAIKRIRRLLGHHRQIDAAAWWEARADDLASLTVAAFAERHDRSVGAVVQARHALLGPRLRPAGWWQAPDVVEILASARPSADVADALGISVGSVRRLRSVLANRSS